MISYVDSEVKIFHPLCEDALNQALKNLSLNSEYEVLHHQYTGTLEMDYVVRNRRTKKYLCVIEVKRTPADVQSTRYQVQAQSYVQMNSPENEKPFYILTNLEKLISFRYDTTKPRVYQQMLLPGLENVCDFSMDDEHKIVNKLAKIFTRLIDEFRNDRYQYLTTLEQFLGYMNSTIADDKKWKSSMAMLMYEYIRGAFRAVRRTEIRYDVHKFHNDIEQICIEANSVDFDGIFAYDSAKYLPRLTMSASILADIYKYGNVNISGDAIADALHNMVSEDKHHEGEVATDLELASLAAVLAKMSNGALANGKKICDPAAGSGNLICSSINIFNAEPNQLIANDINPKLIELLSLRLGLSFPKVIAKPNVAQITTEDIVNLNKSDFKDVDVVLLNPPFVAGINCVNRKVPFYNKIKSLKGSEAITKVGQMNLGAVFLETVCHLVNVGTTIVCIFPKAHLTERGEEAVAFRRMLLNLFGLHTIFNYPAEGLFDSVTEETCIFVGKVLQKTKEVLVYSSDVKVADIDLHALQSVTSGYCRKDFATVFPGVEARVFDWSELDTAVEDGWRMVCSEMSEAIDFANKSFWMNDKLIPLSDSTSNKKCGSTDRGGGTDLLYFETFETLANKYKSVKSFWGVDNVIMCESIVEAIKKINSIESILSEDMLIKIFKGAYTEILSEAQRCAELEDYYLDDYELYEELEIDSVKVVKVEDSFVPLKISRDMILIKTIANVRVAGYGEIFDEDRSVWDNEDKEYFIIEYSDIDFDDGEAQIECEISIKFDFDNLEETARVDRFKFNNRGYIYVSCVNAEITPIDEDEMALRCLREDKGYSRRG